VDKASLLSSDNIAISAIKDRSQVTGYYVCTLGVKIPLLEPGLISFKYLSYRPLLVIKCVLF